VHERGSERADTERQSGCWEKPAWSHLLAQDVQRNLEDDVRDVEYTEYCIVVCKMVSNALRDLGDLEDIP